MKEKMTFFPSFYRSGQTQDVMRRCRAASSVDLCKKIKRQTISAWKILIPSTTKVPVKKRFPEPI